jgi:hypothetical protein
MLIAKKDDDQEKVTERDVGLINSRMHPAVSMSPLLWMLMSEIALHSPSPNPSHSGAYSARRVGIVSS